MNPYANRAIPLILIMGAVLLLANGCGSARRGPPVVEPLEPATAQVKRGQVVFYRACNSCHSGGAASLGPALNNKPLPDWLIRFQVRNGLGVMPAFSEDRISDDEIDALLAYLNALQRREWPDAYLSASDGTPDP